MAPQLVGLVAAAGSHGARWWRAVALIAVVLVVLVVRDLLVRLFRSGGPSDGEPPPDPGDDR